MNSAISSEYSVLPFVFLFHSKRFATRFSTRGGVVMQYVCHVPIHMATKHVCFCCPRQKNFPQCQEPVKSRIRTVDGHRRSTGKIFGYLAAWQVKHKIRNFSGRNDLPRRCSQKQLPNGHFGRNLLKVLSFQLAFCLS